jgi:hypothetical protein
MTTFEHGALSVRYYRPGDEAAILATFNLVFEKECGPGFVARDLVTWNWQFLANPAGTQILLAVDTDGTVASQYCAVPQIADTPFGPQRLVHVVDSMTHPAYRQGLQREGLFAQLGRSFTADYSQHGNEFGYGFPVRIAERIGNRLLDYHLLRRVDYLVRDTALPLPPTPAAITLRTVGAFPTAVDALWQQCRPAVPCAVRRDHRYLDWRWVQNPAHADYVRVLAYSGGQLRGLMVLRPRHELVPGACTIVDWVCHDDDADTAQALLGEACRVARMHGRAHLMAVFAPHDPATGHLLAIGAVLTPSSQWLERRLTYRITGPYVTPDLLAERWRYTLGDTDLC